MKFDFDPPVFIAVDVFPGRPGNPGGLADQHGVAGDQRWPVEHVPGNSAEAVAIALAEAVFGLAVAAD
ncbi:hypothetical protein D3C81_1294120 [compost metagenome]